MRRRSPYLGSLGAIASLTNTCVSLKSCRRDAGEATEMSDGDMSLLSSTKQSHQIRSRRRRGYLMSGFVAYTDVSRLFEKNCSRFATKGQYSCSRFHARHLRILHEHRHSDIHFRTPFLPSSSFLQLRRLSR